MVIGSWFICQMIPIFTKNHNQYDHHQIIFTFTKNHNQRTWWSPPGQEGQSCDSSQRLLRTSPTCKLPIIYYCHHHHHHHHTTTPPTMTTKRSRASLGESLAVHRAAWRLVIAAQIFWEAMRRWSFELKLSLMVILAPLMIGHFSPNYHIQVDDCFAALAPKKSYFSLFLSKICTDANHFISKIINLFSP